MTFTVTSASAISTFCSIGGTPQLVTTTNTLHRLLYSPHCICICDGRDSYRMYGHGDTGHVNEITSSGNIGQASATVCVGEVPPALQM